MSEIESIGKPRIVKSHDVHLDADYADWIAELKHRYRSAQVKASVRVNSEKLLFNWQLGRDLVQKKAEEKWGAGVVEQVSLDLQREFPNAEGFSAPNLWFMKKWYLFYSSPEACEKLYQLGRELGKIKLQRSVGEIGDEKLQRPVAEILPQVGAETDDKKLQQVVREMSGTKLLQMVVPRNQYTNRCRDIQ